MTGIEPHIPRPPARHITHKAVPFSHHIFYSFLDNAPDDTPAFFLTFASCTPRLVAYDDTPMRKLTLLSVFTLR